MQTVNVDFGFDMVDQVLEHLEGHSDGTHALVQALLINGICTRFKCKTGDVLSLAATLWQAPGFKEMMTDKAKSRAEERAERDAKRSLQ